MLLAAKLENFNVEPYGFRYTVAASGTWLVEVDVASPERLELV
jgi:hypothetical protein